MVSDTTLRRYLPAPTVSLLGDLIRALLWALVFILWAAFAQVYVRMIRLTLADPSSSDFTIFYYTARMAADGLPMYGESPVRYGVKWAADHLGNLNPPHFQILFIPLASLSYGQALFAWVGLSAVCLAVSLVLIVRELGVEFTWRRLAVWGAFTIGLAPFTTVAVTSEMTFVLMLPFVLMWRSWRRGAWTSAGAWLGVLLSLKLFFGVFAVWLLVTRRYRALAAMSSSALGLMVLGGLVFGHDSYREWVHSLGTVGWQWMAMNASWPGFVSRVFESGGKIAPVVSWPAVVAPLSILGSSAILVFSLRGSLPAKTHVMTGGGGASAPPVRDRQFLVLLLGAILASPLGWVYYLPLAYAPILGWIGAGRGWDALRRQPRGWLAVAGLAAVLLYVPQELANAGQPSRLATVTAASAYWYGTLLLWLMLLRTRA
jgi:hypothetical protein